MGEQFDLQKYLTNGVEKIVSRAVKAVCRDPKETAFMLRFAAAAKDAAKRREESEQHIPPFLIASITGGCNLHCAGCYARHNHACHDGALHGQLTAAEWQRIFLEGDAMGISFILLAGGEPFLRRDVLEAAADVENVLFPVFTNGTMMDESYLTLFDRARNLIPVFSIEGDAAATDSRRGSGVYEKLMSAMDAMHGRGLIFGASVTVTKENLASVTSEDFLASLREKGCKVVFYVEFVPVTADAAHLAIGPRERGYLIVKLIQLRSESDEMLYISVPGDEKSSGGCLAAGRGFFHINARGGAEPCPFSPHSDINVRDTSLKEALASPLFLALQKGDFLTGARSGGCVLFEKRERVDALLKA